MPETNQSQGASLPPVTDVASAAAHIEGLLSMTTRADDDAAPSAMDDNESTESEETDDVEQDEVDAAQDDENDDPASDETTDEEKDESEQHASTIEPPKSWSAEDAAEFKKLSPHAQEIILRRESERDKAINQRMQQVAEERKAIEAQVHQANQVQSQYAQTLNQLLTMTIPEIQQVEGVNWVELASSDPAEYVRLSAVRDGLRQRVGFMQAEMNHVQQQQYAQLQQAQQAHIANQLTALRETVPEFNDPVKAVAIKSDIDKSMSNFGFSQGEIDSIGDARIVRVLARLVELEKVDAARKSAQAKRTGAPAPKLMTPNAAPAREDNRNKKVQDQYRALKKTGSERDAARLLENFL